MHMARAITEIEEEVRRLAGRDKERLLRLLLEELEGPADNDAERLWLEEIQRRSDALDAGLESLVPAEQVFAEAMRLAAATIKR
jgi:hypothetical protein